MSVTEELTAQERLAEMVEKQVLADYATIKPLFLELEGTTNEFMFGQWRGGSFRGETTISNFYGKRLNSPEHFEPMMSTDDEGKVKTEEHTSELQSSMRSSYAVFCFNNKKI